jgi:hypothetical protein
VNKLLKFTTTATKNAHQFVSSLVKTLKAKDKNKNQ